MRHSYIFLICLLIFAIGSCTQLPGKKPIGSDPFGKPGSIFDGKERISPGVSIHDIFSSEAQKFISQGNFQNALFIYNQAFSQADETQKKQLIPLIEALLTQTPSKDIEQFSQTPNISIPKSLLQYWLGWSLALEDNNRKAKQVLESFILQYPDHHYFVEASNLLEIVNNSMFKKDTIGCLLPLSGKYAIFGQQALAGIQLAVQELSKKYDQKFKIIIEDTNADPIQAVEGVNRLYQRNVSAIIGPLLPVIAAGAKAQELGVPMIALTQKEDFPKQGDFLFSNFITPQMQVQTLGAYLFGELGIKKIAILYPEEKYGRKYMELFWDVVDEYDGEVVGIESYDGHGTDFTKALQKLTGEFYPLPEFLKPEEDEGEIDERLNEDEVIHQEEGRINARNSNKEEIKYEIDFQALFIPDSPSKIKLILPQLAFNDIRNIYLVGTNLWHHEALLEKDIRRYTDNTIITDGFFNESENPKTIDFTKKFESLFDRKPNFLEAIAYDTASIIFLTAMNKDINSPIDLKTALQGGQIYEGATGITVFDSEGNAHRRLFLITIKKNKFVEISH
ncbi:MAG: penicillin-binding protein activator [Pseudomonadota bacterium]